MRKIAIIGGTGIYSPETLQCFEEKVIQTPYGAALCNIGTMCGNQVIFITRHGVGHKTAPHKVNYRANIWALKSLGTEEIFATTAVGSLNPDMEPGHFSRGREDGEGTLLTKDGTRFEGFFKQGKKDGPFVEMDSNGNVIRKGTFKNGRLLEEKK